MIIDQHWNGTVIDVETGQEITGVWKLPSGKMMLPDGTIPLQGNGVPTLKELENAKNISLPKPDINSIVDELKIQGFEQTSSLSLNYVTGHLGFRVDIELYFNTNSITHKISWEHQTYTINQQTGDIESQGEEKGFEIVFGPELYKRAVAITSDLISKSPFLTI